MNKKEYLKLYGFLGIGQAGGNLTRKFEESGYPCVVANSSTEDLMTRNAKINCILKMDRVAIRIERSQSNF